MSKKALFFDIDGTLMSEVTRAVPESTSEALAKARSLGHLVFINTGRSYSQLEPIQAVVEADGWLCGCGTYVEAEGEVLYHRVIPPAQAEKIKAAIIEYNLEGVLEGKEGCSYSHESSRFAIGKELIQMINFSLRSGTFGGDTPFEKFCVMTDEQSDKASFFRSIGLGINVINRGNCFYECIPAGHSKATAIEMILSHYHLDLADAYAFGDSMNDLPMFEYVPNAILMGKHDKELEPFASFVTKTVEKDGIAYAMNRLGLLE
ncbi:MAG: Cof-type HAD-IIB family hydrolase [Lachnospiraceae bacterium]